MQRRGRFASIVVVGVACAGALVMLSVLNADSRWQRGLDATSTNNDRIDPDELHLLNMDSFKEELKHDLPPGTAKEEVEAYLNRRKFAYHFVGPDERLRSDRNTFYALVEDTGPRLIYLYFQIRIRLDEQDKVRRIEFRLSY